MRRMSRVMAVTLSVTLSAAVIGAPSRAADPVDELPTSDKMRAALLDQSEMLIAYPFKSAGGAHDPVYRSTTEACARTATNGEMVDSVSQTFMKHGTGPTMIEQTITAVGYDRTIDMVEAYAGMIRECPSRRLGSGVLTVSTWKGPRWGDASAGLLWQRINGQGQITDRDVAVYIAYGDVVLTMAHLNNQDSDDDADFTKLVAVAYAKLDQIG